MDKDYLEELFEPFGPVTVKRMFGGQGVFFENLCMAVVVDGSLRMRGDAQSGPMFEEAGCSIWTYTRKDGKQAAMPYWSVSEDWFDDPDAFTRWAHIAFESALRADAAKPASKRKYTGGAL